MNSDICVIIPVFNEVQNIGALINNISNYDIIVVDDGSYDGTKTVLENVGVKYITHIINLGQWAAIRTGFKIALLKKYKIIVTLDGDGQHNPDEIINLIEPIKNNSADVVIGSRFLNKSDLNMSKYRFFGIKFFNLLLDKIYNIKLTDCTSGFKAYKLNVIEVILPYLHENQYGSLESILYISKNHFTITEMPISSRSSIKSSKGSIKYGYNLLKTLFS